MKMNYFEFFEIEESFFLDESILKKRFLKNSRKYHPDFYTQADESAQEEAMELSTLNNNAYKVLKDFDTRVKYILDINDTLGPEGKNTMPQTFLMEMMDINEALMELEFDFDSSTLVKVQDEFKEMSDSLYSKVEEEMKTYAKGEDRANDVLQSVKDYYLKNKYLLRIKEKIDTFATR